MYCYQKWYNPFGHNPDHIRKNDIFIVFGFVDAELFQKMHNSASYCVTKHIPDKLGKRCVINDVNARKRDTYYTVKGKMEPKTHCAAILMNFLRSWTRLLSVGHKQTSVTTQSWTSLNLRRNRSRLAVVFLKCCRPNV